VVRHTNGSGRHTRIVPSPPPETIL
jgi:hypothetical protein